MQAPSAYKSIRGQVFTKSFCIARFCWDETQVMLKLGNLGIQINCLGLSKNERLSRWISTTTTADVKNS